MNVLVINQCAHNKGDRAVLAFLLHELVRNGITSITVSTSEPRFWGAHDVQGLDADISFIPWGWAGSGGAAVSALQSIPRRLYQRWMTRVAYPALRRALLADQAGLSPRLACNRQFRHALEHADLVISTGGHHVTTLLAPDAISPQLFDMGLTLLAGKPLVCWSQSFGPFDFQTEENKAFVTRVMNRAACLYTRDHASVDRLQALGVEPSQIRPTLESVIALSDVLENTLPPSERPPVLGIAVYAVKRRTPEEYRHYINSLATLVDAAGAAGYTTRFFPMAIRGTAADDRPLIRDIIAASHQQNRCVLIDEDLPTVTHLAEVAQCRMFAGHKTHSVIFALTTATPLIALAYHVKTVDFMRQYALADYAIPDEELTGDALTNLFTRLDQHLDAVSRQQQQQTREFSDVIHRDFSQMLTRVR
ncbi:MAG: colanic acid biosynthesis protein [bacterium ADurb.Bin429]|nr:MAG: colanic acid biosynthesis protein [bacterium ADurb.Bin429]